MYLLYRFVSENFVNYYLFSKAHRYNDKKKIELENIENIISNFQIHSESKKSNNGFEKKWNNRNNYKFERYK